MKKILALVLAMLLVLGMTSALAVSVTVNAIPNDQAVNHLYYAYRIFSGDVSSDNQKLSNVQFSTGVSADPLVTSLQANLTLDAIPEIHALTTSSSANDVSEALGKISSNSDAAEALATVLNTYFTTSGTYVKKGPGVRDANNGSYAIDIGTDYGYYFVRDEQTAYKDSADKATTYTGTTKYVLQVIGDLTIAPKTSVPQIDKKTMDDVEITTTTDLTQLTNTDWKDSADYDIGDVVPFKITVTLGDISKFDSYYVQISDTLSKGLLYQNNAKIYIQNPGAQSATDVTSAFTANTNAVETDSKNAASTITFTADNVKAAAIGAQSGAVITLYYSAKLGNSAEFGSTGNPNTAKVVYSNNPNNTGTGETPDDKVTIFTFKLVTNKVKNKAEKEIISQAEYDALDAAGKDCYEAFDDGGTTKYKVKTEALNGAGFTLFKKLSALPNGATAQTTPEAATAVGSYYTDGTNFYQSVATHAASSTKNSFDFPGLDAGEYKLVETTVPDGYNKAADVDITITAVHEPTSDDPKLTKLVITPDTIAITVTGDNTDETSAIETTGIGTLDVLNRQGSTLPSTGGIGTTLFYVGGGVLILLAVVLLVTKRRMSSND